MLRHMIIYVYILYGIYTADEKETKNTEERQIAEVSFLI